MQFISNVRAGKQKIVETGIYLTDKRKQNNSFPDKSII